MSRVYILTIVGSELNLTADFVRAEINNRRSYLIDSFITIPELSIKQAGIVDSTLEVRLLPTHYGSFYEIVLFDISDNELLRCFFIMPERDCNLHELRLLTAYPEVTSIATSFLALSDTPNSYTGQAGKMVAVKADESGLEFIEGCTGEPPIEIPLGCEGSVDHITVGVITDGGLIDVYLNDVLLEVETNFFFRIGGAAEKLRMHGIDVTALTAQGLPALDHGGGRYYEAEQAAFSNTTSNYQKIRIKTIDANAVDQNHTPENQSFDSESELNTTTFCLAPQAEAGISCAGATNSFKYVLAIRNNAMPSPDTLVAYIDGVADIGTPLTWLNEEILNENYPFPVPAGYSVGQGVAKISNLDSSNHRFELKSNSDDLLIFIYDNPTVIQMGEQPNRHVGVCLAPHGNPVISCEGATQIAAFRMSFPQIDNWNLLYNNPLVYLDFSEMFIDDQSAGYNIGSDWAEFGVDVVVTGLWNGEPPSGTQEWINGALVEFKAIGPVEHRVKFNCLSVESYNQETNPTIIDLGSKTYGFCLAAQTTELTCTPETASQSVELYQARQSLPFTTFWNVAFNIYENGELIANEFALSSVSDMSLVGLEVLFMDETNRRITISNRLGSHRLIRLEPTTTSMLQDVDIVNGNAVIDGDSFFLCLAGGCEPTEFVMTENSLFEGGSVRLDYIIDAPNHGISNVSKRFSMTDIARSTYLSEIVRLVIAQIKEDHPFIAFRDTTGSAVANFDFWTYRSTVNGSFPLTGVSAELSNDPITIKFVKNGFIDDLFPLIFPTAAVAGITEYSAHSCGTQELIGI